MIWRALVLLALLGGGCVQVEGFDPVGSVAAITGKWTIDGSDPTSSLCELLGADRVQVTFLDGERPVTHSALFFQCRLQSFDTNTARGAGAVVGAGTWAVRLDAIDTSGDIVAVGSAFPVPVAARVDGVDAGPIEVIGGDPDTDGGILFTANFLSATISTQFLIAGLDASDQRCLDASIHEVELEDTYTEPGGAVIVRTQREPCSLGLIGIRVLPDVGHVVVMRAFDEGGAQLAERGPFSVTPSPGENVGLDADGPIEL